MKKLILALFLVASLNLDAQYLTNFAKNVNTKDVDGFYYHLPRNIIRLDFVIEKEELFKGKYSAFAKEMLNTDNYIKENNISYRIKSVSVNTLTEADPNYVFFISASDEKTKDNLNLNLELTSDGIIQSFGYKDSSIEKTKNDFFNQELDIENKLSEYNYISIRDDDDDEQVVDKITEKDIAASIVEEIKKLRVAYFDLITGYQEVNYGTTINYMVDEIKNLENELLNMFLGTTNIHTYTKTFYIIPEEGKNSIVLGKFSATEGFNAKTGENVKINFTDSSIGNNVNILSKDDIENVTYSNKIFYRSPANVTMQISIGENKFFENRLTINQFGNLILVPINKMKLVFDTNTGQILSVIKE